MSCDRALYFFARCARQSCHQIHLTSKLSSKKSCENFCLNFASKESTSLSISSVTRSDFKQNSDEYKFERSGLRRLGIAIQVTLKSSCKIKDIAFQLLNYLLTLSYFYSEIRILSQRLLPRSPVLNFAKFLNFSELLTNLSLLLKFKNSILSNHQVMNVYRRVWLR